MNVTPQQTASGAQLLELQPGMYVRPCSPYSTSIFGFCYSQKVGYTKLYSIVVFLFVLKQQELRHDSARGGVAILTDKTNPVTSTSLLLRHVRLSDSGKYSCTPSNADPASVTLHVLQGLCWKSRLIALLCSVFHDVIGYLSPGERPAAMQSNGGVSILLSSPLMLSTLFLGSVWLLDRRLTTWITWSFCVSV